MKKKKLIIQIILSTLMILMALITLLPFWLLISASLTGSSELYTYGYSLFPRTVSFESYMYILKMSDSLIHSYLISIITTVSGTAISLLITTLMAYPLSNPKFKARNTFAFIVFFTMLFNGGLVSSYFMYTRIFVIKDTIWAQIFPGMLMGAMNVMLVRNYFATSIPYEIHEAAKIDGASELGIFYRIVVPLSKPIMAAIGLMTALGYWNNWTNGYYYVSDIKYKSYQNILDGILKQIQFLSTMTDTSTATEVMNDVPSISVRMTLAVIGAVPILIVYPFFEKYFEKGLTLGTVKG